MKELDLIGIAKSFGLLRLPRMPEMKDLNREDWEDAEVDVSPIISCSPALLFSNRSGIHLPTQTKLKKQKELLPP